MGNTLKTIFKAFECTSECSIKHELDLEIKNINFQDIELNQKEIKLINNIIKKKKSIT